MPIPIVSHMATTEKPLWWQDKPGRWNPKLEEALASDSPGRRGLAWCIILETGGGPKCIKAFDHLYEVGYKTLLNQINGATDVSKPLIRKVAEKTGVGINIIWSGAHPFAVPYIHADGFVEPGDRNWETIYAAMRSERDEMRTIEELRSEYPKTFPDWVLTDPVT